MPEHVWGIDPAGANQACLIHAESACPACKGSAFTVPRSIGAEPPPTCFDCLTNKD